MGSETVKKKIYVIEYIIGGHPFYDYMKEEPSKEDIIDSLIDLMRRIGFVKEARVEKLFLVCRSFKVFAGFFSSGLLV